MASFDILSGRSKPAGGIFVECDDTHFELSSGNLMLKESYLETKIAQIKNDVSYAPYYVQSSAPSSPYHGWLWYDTDDNTLYQYNAYKADWVEVDWVTIIQATPEWQAGKLQISSGVLQIYNGSSWFDCYPLIGSTFFKIMDYTKKYYQQIGTFVAIVSSDQVPIVFAREMINCYRIYARDNSPNTLIISNILSSGNIWNHVNLAVYGHGGYDSSNDRITFRSGGKSSSVCEIVLTSALIRCMTQEYYHDGGSVWGVMNASSTLSMPSTAYYLGVLNTSGTIIVERKASI